MMEFYISSCLLSSAQDRVYLFRLETNHHEHSDIEDDQVKSIEMIWEREHCFFDLIR